MNTSPTIVARTSKTRKPLTFRTPDFAAIAARLGLPYLHQRADGSWAVPSGTRAGVEYTVWLTCPASPTCTCDGFAYRGRCYHILIAQAKAQLQSPPPAVEAVASGEAERAAVVARGRAAVDDLCGTAAAA